MEKTVKIGLCLLDEFDIPIKTQLLNARWTEDTDVDLKEHFNVEIEKEIAVILTSEIKKSITEESVYELLKGIKS